MSKSAAERAKEYRARKRDVVTVRDVTPCDAVTPTVTKKESVTRHGVTECDGCKGLCPITGACPNSRLSAHKVRQRVGPASAASQVRPQIPRSYSSRGRRPKLSHSRYCGMMDVLKNPCW